MVIRLTGKVSRLASLLLHELSQIFLQQIQVRDGQHKNNLTVLLRCEASSYQFSDYHSTFWEFETSFLDAKKMSTEECFL